MNNSSEFWGNKNTSKKIIIYNYNNLFDPIKKQENHGFIHNPNKLSIIFYDNQNDIINFFK